MFVNDEAALDISFEVALARFAALAGSGALTRVSADAYAAGASSDGPWLALSRFHDLVTEPGRAALAVRWETSGRDGEPFPVLDADLTLIPAGPRGPAPVGQRLPGRARRGRPRHGRDAPRRLSGPDRQDDHPGGCRRQLGPPGTEVPAGPAVWP
jgi:hypothetical protein